MAEKRKETWRPECSSSDCNMQMSFLHFFKSRKESTQRRASSGETKTRVTLAFDITDSGIFKRGPWEKVKNFSHGLECGMVPFVVVIINSV